MQAASASLDRVDHLVLAVPDLAAGIAKVRDMLAVEATPGGSHPAFGTANALVGLGVGSYLEIMGPDPAAPDPPELFGIRGLASARLVTWAAKFPGLAEANRRREIPEPFGTVEPGHRRRPDGSLLEWQLSDPYRPRFDGVVPFLIDWGAGEHPSSSLEHDCRLIDLRLGHPTPEEPRRLLETLGIGLEVDRASQPAVVAVIETPAGVVELA